MAKERNIFMPVLMLGSVLGCVVGALLIWMAFQDNNQGEFIDPQSGEFQWSAVISVFLASFIIVLLPSAVIGALLQWAYHKSRKLRGKSFPDKADS